MKTKTDEPNFEEALRNQKKLLVLFYASWCPFSRRFLPVYEKCTLDSPTSCIRVKIDDREDLCEKYEIQIYPTVILFENGQIAKRLDGKPGEGLDEKQLRTLLGIE